ncbi:MAG: 3-oxoacyl-[acyl-carrier-protein] reductase [Lachnospiraceae bacterium]|nr:3-oxoacyl-[acyl-carrier-protein] reductase [Lachnospiraceae bacterium]
MLKDKTALVTGAGRGIGRAIALKLAKLGAKVIVNYSGSKEKAEETVALIQAEGGDAEALRCDVSDYEACGELAKNVLAKYGRLDILVNNAGITKDGLLMGMSEEDYDRVLDTNLKGTFNMMRHFSRSFMKQRSGRIINIASVSGVLGNAGQANYSASKAGVIGLTKSAAREMASRGICVNAIAPGFIDTDMVSAMGEDIRGKLIEKIPLGRVGQAEEIAEAVAFLAGDAAGYITGQVLCVDGGMAI